MVCGTMQQNSFTFLHCQQIALFFSMPSLKFLYMCAVTDHSTYRNNIIHDYSILRHLCSHRSAQFPFFILNPRHVTLLENYQNFTRKFYSIFTSIWTLNSSAMHSHNSTLEQHSEYHNILNIVKLYHVDYNI